MPGTREPVVDSTRSDDLDRRTFLRYGGAATVAASVGLSGCLNGDPDDDAGVTDDNGVADDADDADDTDDTDDQDEEFHVTVTQGQLTDTLDPVADNATPVYNIVDQIYEPFLYRDRDGRPIERIVTDWEREDDHTIRLEIREGVQFHSGNELIPEDVAFSINRANDPDESDVAAVIGAIDEATVEDGDVVVSLDAVEPAIFQNLTAFGRVVEEEWVEERDGSIDEETNGTGPFELVEFVDDTRVEYERFDEYWGEEPEVESGTFNAQPEDGPRVEALLAGETDLVVNVPPDDLVDIDEADEADSEFVPSIRSIFLVMNDVHEPFDSLEFRQAMNYAVDVQSIVDSILNEFGVPTSQPTLEGHIGYNPDIEPYPYDPEQAEQLIEESGYAGEEITLHTPVGRYLGDVDVAETAAGQIDDLENVSCDVDRRDFGDLVGELLDDRETSPPFFLIGWGNPTFDANYTMAPWFLPGAFQHFEDEEMTQLLSEANDLPDGDERTAILEEANAHAHEIAPWVFLHQQYSIYGKSGNIEWEAREDEDILFEEMSRG